MQENYPGHKIITDIGSGINFKRKGLRSIIQMACKGLISEVVVAYRDRLCRFAFELVEWILQINGVKLLVLNSTLDSTGTNELAEDVLAIINVFNCRINGKRKYKNSSKEQKGKNNGQSSQENSSESES
jgi:predicted site-specific integrase-resolvase